MDKRLLCNNSANYFHCFTYETKQRQNNLKYLLGTFVIVASRKMLISDM